MNFKASMQVGLAVGSLLAAALLQNTMARADTGQFDPVVVSASKVSSPMSQVGSSITVITAQDLENQGCQTVSEALASVPGLDVVVSGGPGQLTETYVRGAESGRTLVMINGIEINDAMSAGRSVDFSHLTVDNVERIEVLRGPESAVFGSGAMGGVINIITKKGSKDLNASANISGGKYSTWNAGASASGTFSDWDASLGTSWDYSAGFPALKPTSAMSAPGQDLASNDYRNWTIDASMGGTILQDWTARVSARSFQGYSQLVDYDMNFLPLANSDYSVKTQEETMGFESDWKLNSGWRQTLTAGLSQQDRYYREVPVPSAAENDSDYLGRNLNMDWHSQWDLPAAGSALVLGVNYRQEQGRTEDPVYGDFPERSAHCFGYYLEERLQVAGFTLDAAARADVQNLFGNAFTYRLAPVYLFEPTGTSFKGTWGTGFNAPTLYQLYAPFYGNADLQPEKSVGWDAGVEQKILNSYKLGSTYFQNDFQNQVDFNSAFQYVNLAKTQTKGWELFGAAEPITDLIFKLGYTKLTANDLTQEDTLGPLPLIRRSDYKITLDAGYTWHGAHLQLSVQHVGPRWDKDNVTNTRVTLAPYTLANLYATYALTSTLSVFARVNNVMDANYTEVFGYNTPRFAAMGGLKYNWN